MKPRPIREEDYEKIVSWYADVEWPTPAVDGSLPIKGGFVVEMDGGGELAACVWVSSDETSALELKWPATNPQLDPKAQSNAFDHLIRFVQQLVPKLKPMGRLLTLYTRSEALAAALERSGFRKKAKYIQCTWVASV